MDIKAVQAEASTKATAWLGENLPVETAQPAPIVSPPASTPPVATPPVVPEVQKPGLADTIRAAREARTAVAQVQTEVSKYKGEVEALRKENEQLKTQSSASDPFEFLKHRKLSKEEQALWGRAFLYDLKPEVAPQEFRLELYKAEQERKEAAAAEAATRAAQEAAARTNQENFDRYANELMQHVQSSVGSNPESENWFTEEAPGGQPTLNQRAYAQSLLATADNLARQAQKAGQQADLSPANVAKVLEAEVSKRMARRDARRASNAPVQKQVPVQPAQGGKQATDTTTSAEGLRSGAPMPKDMSEEARRARAAAVLAGIK